MDFQATMIQMIRSLEDSDLAKMDLETKLRKWFNEFDPFDTGSFDVVTYCKKLEDLLNNETATKTLFQEADVNQGLQKYFKPHRFVKTLGDRQFQQPDNSVLNLCDIFEVCKVNYGPPKVDASCDIENAYFCKIVELLIKTKHYDVNDKIWDDTGLHTPLSLACTINEEGPNIKCIEMLLENGADTNIKIGMTGDTILHEFLTVTKTDDKTCLEVIKLFTIYGYNINTVSSIGHTLLHTCVRCPFRMDLIKPLVELGVDITLKDAHGREAFHVRVHDDIDFWKEVDVWQELLCFGLDVNQRDYNDCTLLMLLVFLGSDIDKLSYILREGCDVNAVDKCGRTALHYVFTGEIEYIHYEYINVLIDAGIDYLIKDKFHKTAFHYIGYIPQEQQAECLCYIFNQYGQLFSQLDLKLRLNENFLSRYDTVTKQLTERLINRNFYSSHSFLYEALDVLTEDTVSDILYTKGIGTIEKFPVFHLVYSQVDLVMKKLATQLSKNTHLSFEARLSGSASEKCKVGFPDEFDYLFIIDGMEKYFNIQPTQTPGFASVQKKTIQNFPEEFFCIVNECDFMVSINFLHYFSQKVLEVLHRINIWEGTELYCWNLKDGTVIELFPKANVLLRCRYHLPSFKDIDISIDVVAALPIPHDKLETFLVNYIEFDSPKLFVLPTKSEGWSLDSLHRLRVSTSFVETDIISSLPKYLRNAFMLLKILKEHGKKKEFSIINHGYLTTYQLKTVLLYTRSKILKSNRSLEQNSDQIKSILEAASIMIQQYSKFKEDENMPSYFFKKNLLE